MSPIKLDCMTIRMIAAAVAEGRVVAVPQGARALAERAPDPVSAPWRPEACGRGRQVERAPALDEIDGERP